VSSREVLGDFSPLCEKSERFRIADSESLKRRSLGASREEIESGEIVA